MPPSSLKRSTFRGAVSLGGATVVVRVVGIVGVVFLARLVDPQAFGLVALCYLVLSVVSLLAPLGLGGALIQHRGDPDQASFQVLAVTLATGLLAFLAVNLLQGPIASLLGEQKVTEILPAVSVLILLEAVARVPEALMERELKFDRLGVIMVATDVAYFVVAIPLAAAGHGVWSLVYGILAKAAVGSSLSWILVGSWRWVRLRPWNTPLMRDLFRYGFQSLGSRTAYYFYLNADNFVVGRELGAAALGYYSKAFDFTKKTVDNINKVLGTVLFPTYARIQDDIQRLSRAYLNSLQVISSITVPASIALFLLSDRIVPVLLGPRWLPMIPILQVLAFMSLVKPISSTTAAVFNAVGRPKFNMHAGIVVSVVLILGMILLLPYGTVGIATAVVISHVVGLVFNVYQINTILPRIVGPMLVAVKPTAIATACMTAVIIAARELPVFGGERLPPVVSLIILMAAGGGSYLLSLYFVGRSVLAGVVELLPSRKGAAA